MLELLWCEGCPSVDRALSELREATAELGLEGVEIAIREIRSGDEAAAAGFLGSPTILIDGVDVIASEPPRAGLESAEPPPAGLESAEPESAALTCRVYRRRDGRFSPTPDPDDLRAALRARVEVRP